MTTGSTPAKSEGLSFTEILKSDLPASLVVFLVAVPLCMGIALASGAPIMSGLVAGIVGGLMVGLLGGAPLLVSGPAAGLAVMVFGIIDQFGFAAACAVFVAAGLIQVALGALKVARMALMISPAVIHGMLAGIGVLIAASQLHIVLGGSPKSNFWSNLGSLPEALAVVSVPSLVLGAITVAILLAWPSLPANVRKVPAPLVAVVTASAVAYFWGADVAKVQLAGDLFASLRLPELPASNLWGAFAIAAVSLAIVASAESLLSAVATDKMHSGPRANLDKELLAQGLANTASGLAGGLPITGVIVRSAANIAAGARTRWSAVLHGVWLLAFVTLFGALAGLVPLAVLAGLLVHVGVKLVNPATIRELRVRHELSVYLVTLFGVVGINLLAGIGIGLAFAAIRLLYRLATVKVQVQRADDAHNIHIGGNLTFVGVPRLTSALATVPAGAAVKVDLDVRTLDHSGYEALHSWAQMHSKTGGRVQMEPLEEIWSRHGAPAAVPQPVPTRNPTLVTGGAQ